MFVSGSWGTLTFGDTNGADEQWVGDVPGDYSLTGLGDLDETPFVSNGGGFGNDNASSFANNPEARPTVRYDFDIMGFGLSLSSNRDLTDIAVGTGYSADFGGGSWSAGVGYNKLRLVRLDRRRGGAASSSTDPITGDLERRSPGADVDEHRSGRRAVVGRPEGHLRRLRLRPDLRQDQHRHAPTSASAEADNLLVGASFGWDDFSVGLVYGKS